MVEAISASHKCEATELLTVVNGGQNYGTWMHEDERFMLNIGRYGNSPNA